MEGENVGKVRRMFTMTQIKELTGFSDSTVWAKIKGGTFPPPVKLGPRSNRWPENVIGEWQAALVPGVGEGKPRGLKGQYAKTTTTAPPAEETPPTPVKKKRGRPRKNEANDRHEVAL